MVSSVFTHVASIYANLWEQKKVFYVRKEFNSHRICGLEHQYGRRFTVLEHQYGGRNVMWIRSLLNFVKEENKLDYKVHLSVSFCKLLFLVQIYFSISYLLFTLTIKLSMFGSTSFILELQKYYFPYMYKIIKQGAFGS